MRRAFGECVFDEDTRQVLRDGRPRHVGPTAYALLQLLLDSRPRVLSKLDLLRRVWPGLAVSESSLSTAVAELRDALGDAARAPRYIRTVYGFGYAFIATVVELDAAAAREGPNTGRLRLEGPGCCFTLGPGCHLVGRAPTVSVAIDDPAVSRRHARLVVSASSTTAEDLGSRNGTRRNGVRIVNVVRLDDGDTLAIGPVTLRVRRADVVSCATETCVPDARA